MAKKNKNRIRSVVKPFSPKQIRRETKARVRLEFGDAGRALRGDIRASRQQSKNLNAWYQQYQGNMDRLRQGQLANTEALQRDARANAGLMNQAANTQRQALDAEEQRSAALRGASTSGAGATEAAGETQRQALMASTRDRNAQIGSSAYNRLAEVNAAAELGRQADQRRERGNRLESRSKLRDLARDKGASRIKNRADIIRGERDFSIQNRTLNANIADDRADNALARQKENRIASEGSGGSGGSGGGGGGAGGYKPGEIRAATGQLRLQLGEGGISPRSPRDIRQNKRSILDELIAPPNAIDTRLAQIAYRRILKQAIRWDRNPNNVGSSAWKEKQRERQGS